MIIETQRQGQHVLTITLDSDDRYRLYVDGTHRSTNTSAEPLRLLAESIISDLEWQDYQDDMDASYEASVQASYTSRDRANLY